MLLQFKGYAKSCAALSQSLSLCVCHAGLSIPAKWFVSFCLSFCHNVQQQWQHNNLQKCCICALFYGITATLFRHFRVKQTLFSMPPAFLFHSRVLARTSFLCVLLSPLCICESLSLSLHLCAWCCSLLVAVFVLLFPSRIATVNDRSHERTVKATETSTTTATLAALAFWQFFALRIF